MAGQVSIEKALDKAKSILEDSNRLQSTLSTIDGETSSPSLTTPVPRSFKVGDYLGREEILAEIPAVTVEARPTTEMDTQEAWKELRHTLWVWAFVAEVDPEKLHRYMVRYGEGIRRLLGQQRYWGGGWHNPVASQVLPTGVFQATHRLLQGCRVQVEVSEIVREEL